MRFSSCRIILSSSRDRTALASLLRLPKHMVDPFDLATLTVFAGEMTSKIRAKAKRGKGRESRGRGCVSGTDHQGPLLLISRGDRDGKRCRGRNFPDGRLSGFSGSGGDGRVRIGGRGKGMGSASDGGGRARFIDRQAKTLFRRQSSIRSGRGRRRRESLIHCGHVGS